MGCQLKPQLGELVKDMVVQTNYDNSVDFAGYATYTMPLDTLGRVSGSSSDTLIVTEYAGQITGILRNNLDGRGYSHVDKNQDPDIGVTAYIVDDLNIFQSVNYYNYYPSYYGYYSPYYYNYPQINTYAYNTAVLVIEMVDLKNPDSQGQFKVVWAAYVGDVLNSTDPFEKSAEAVNQAFDQSPYLTR
jgi:hypothetical protein